MEYLVFIFIALGLFIGFLVLSEYEMRRSVRLFARERARLDERIARIEFIIEHVDFGAFLREEVHHFSHLIAREVAHLSLQTVRAVERLLTRLVRHLHTQRAIDQTPRENAREFVKTLSDFKGRLGATHPKIPGI
ncbi:hypothetical protein A2609_01585 [Candidatus Kaiserbacteria bacterium RIFOXYD1_FULL_47_14]|uniref:Uncharacterized protein n=1 Tax=Candidatus Kaiserbacteria bacterium RIFOXYD1_FULL_47_14 TaxID=1798533 RepID=A0A1F6G5H5_9BACT|nr:MAG: hypothetical protein A2609_01585 [Candidatus Kaiserbacteria bacterium RIFOXYD1_FULL_47_14]